MTFVSPHPYQSSHTCVGYIDDVHGYDFGGACSATDSSTGQCSSCSGRGEPRADSSTDPMYYHGTHVAGIVGALRNNGIGGTGVAPNVKLMILRVRGWLKSGGAGVALERRAGGTGVELT